MVTCLQQRQNQSEHSSPKHPEPSPNTNAVTVKNLINLSRIAFATEGKNEILTNNVVWHMLVHVRSWNTFLKKPFITVHLSWKGKNCGDEKLQKSQTIAVYHLVFQNKIKNCETHPCWHKLCQFSKFRFIKEEDMKRFVKGNTLTLFHNLPSPGERKKNEI